MVALPKYMWHKDFNRVEIIALGHFPDTVKIRILDSGLITEVYIKDLKESGYETNSSERYSD